MISILNEVYLNKDQKDVAHLQIHILSVFPSVQTKSIFVYSYRIFFTGYAPHNHLARYKGPNVGTSRADTTVLII
jgi:hypothetical protein